MNVKSLLLLVALASFACTATKQQARSTLQIEIPFGNPYKHELDAIHGELLEVYDVVKVCIDHFLMDLPLASGAEIEENCVGKHFSIINHIFLLKMKKAMELYNRSLTERFDQAYSTYPDEIAYFMSLYKMFLEKGFHNLFNTMQLAKRGSRYYVREDIYDSLLELSKEMLEIIGEFSGLLVKEKNNIKEFIKEKLIERDENLKIMLRLDKSGETESQAHADVVSEAHKKPATLADKIRQMDSQLKQQTEHIRGGSPMREGQLPDDESSKAGKYVPFEDSFAPSKTDSAAENELMQEFTPNAIKLSADDDDEPKINENVPVQPASEPKFKDELDFYYERPRGL